MIGMDHISQEDKVTMGRNLKNEEVWYKGTNRTTNKKDIIQSDMRRLLNENFWGFLLIQDKYRNQSLKVHRVCKIKEMVNTYFLNYLGVKYLAFVLTT